MVKGRRESESWSLSGVKEAWTTLRRFLTNLSFCLGFTVSLFSLNIHSWHRKHDGVNSCQQKSMDFHVCLSTGFNQKPFTPSADATAARWQVFFFFFFKTTTRFLSGTINTWFYATKIKQDPDLSAKKELLKVNRHYHHLQCQIWKCKQESAGRLMHLIQCLVRQHKIKVERWWLWI